MRARWSELASSPSARRINAVLLAAQLGIVALEWLDEQPLLARFLCPLAWDVYEAGAGPACIATAVIFFASLVTGVLTLRFAGLRPCYWALLLLVPISIGGQLLYMHALGLDEMRVHHA